MQILYSHTKSFKNNLLKYSIRSWFYLGKYLLFTFCSICIAQTDTDLYQLQDFETYLKEEIVSQRAAGIEVLINCDSCDSEVNNNRRILQGLAGENEFDLETGEVITPFQEEISNEGE